MALLNFLLVLVLAGCFCRGSAEFEQCERTYVKVGCYSLKYTKDSLTDFMLGYRDQLKWDQYPESLHSLACKCVKLAREKKYKVFSIRFYGECWGGKNGTAFMSNPYAPSTDCIGGDYESCVVSSQGECAGDKFLDYVYKVDDLDVDGGYSPWSSWSTCSASCGQGVRSRERTCTNPAPEGNGKNCESLGPEVETGNCQVKGCPVDGGFSKWTPATQCSKSCGGGAMTMTRTCTNPKPANGGKNCTGPTSMSKTCNEDPCKVDGGYTQWKRASTCSKSCGGGYMTYTRTCTNPIPAHGGKNCSGPSSKTATCNEKPCPVNGGYTKWKLASKCSKSCGGGFMRYTRTCTNPKPAHGGKKCSGPSSKTVSCNRKRCPVNGGYTKWKATSKCSRSCGGGYITYTRTCTNPRPAHGGKRCSGPSRMTKRCNTHTCPGKLTHAVICEHKPGRTISCPAGTAILIKYANYGRISSRYCGYRRNYNVRCRSGTSLATVKRKCDGQRSCFLLASNGIYGDPCRGTVKYLEVKYRCQKPKSTTAYACEHSPAKTISCNTGTAIQVIAANYGRLSNRICRAGYQRNTKCVSKTSLSKVKASCNNKQRCKLHATNYIFGDPCVGIRKYLSVEYRCVPSLTHTRMVCENGRLYIACRSSYKINIVHASYGRLSLAYCRRHRHSTWHCHSRHSLAKTRALCNGRKSCHIWAKNSVFGDPCHGIYKYLQVDYQCVPQS